MTRFPRRCRSKDEEGGFTLVELIITVVITAILSTIAIQIYQNIITKSHQREASTLLNAYLKGIKSYHIETGSQPTMPEHLREHVSVIGCKVYDYQACKSGNQVNPSGNRKWKSPSGLYEIALGQDTDSQGGAVSYLTAIPRGDFESEGLPVYACYNLTTGVTSLSLIGVSGVDIPRWTHRCK